MFSSILILIRVRCYFSIQLLFRASISFTECAVHTHVTLLHTHTHGEKEKDSVWFCRIIHLFQFAFHVHKCSVFQCLFLKIFCIVSSLSVIKILWWTKSILYLSHFSCNPAAAKCEHHPFRTMPTCAYYCFYYIDTVEPKWFINFRIIIFNWILFEGDFRSKIMKINSAQIFATSNIKHKWKERKKKHATESLFQLIWVIGHVFLGEKWTMVILFYVVGSCPDSKFHSNLFELDFMEASNLTTVEKIHHFDSINWKFICVYFHKMKRCFPHLLLSRTNWTTFTT